MQMTDIAVREVYGRCQGLYANPNLNDSYTNIRYGTCYLQHAYRVTGNWREALIMYNGGITQVLKYRRGDDMAAETANYIIKVERALSTCQSDFVAH